jgi:hypothetical protein
MSELEEVKKEVSRIRDLAEDNFKVIAELQKKK